MSKTDSLSPFWKKVAHDIEQVYLQGCPTKWSRTDTEVFLEVMKDTILKNAKVNSLIAKRLRILPTKGGGQNFETISSSYFEKIFRYKHLPGNRTRYQFAAYFGFDSLVEYERSEVVKPVNNVDENTGENNDERLTVALKLWKHKIEQDDKWQPVQILSHASLSSSRLYQPIYVSQVDVEEKNMTLNAGEMEEFQHSQQAHERSLDVIPLASLVLDTSLWSVVIGVPGSGKTSALKWLLQQAGDDQNNFDSTIYISLYDLDKHLKDYPESCLYTCFFKTYLNQKQNAAENLGELLNNAVNQKERRILFLFDGLDEVTQQRRHYIITHIQNKLSDQKVIITSRSSAFQKLSTLMGKASFYDIVALRPAAVRNLVKEYCYLSSDKLPEGVVLQKISENINLQRLVTTPFMLIVICEIIQYLHESKEDTSFTRATIYSYFVKQIQLDFNRHNDDVLEEEDLEELVCFAEKLSFSKDGKQIMGRLSRTSSSREVLGKSKFINEIGSSPGVFEFIHLSLQEYFTAMSIQSKGAEAVERFMREKAFNIEWLEVTCFLVDIARGTSFEQIINACLVEHLTWIKKEKTGNGWYILAKIQAAKGESLQSEQGLGINLYAVLLEYILEDHALKDKFVDILMDSDLECYIKDLYNRHDPGDFENHLTFEDLMDDLFLFAPYSVQKRIERSNQSIYTSDFAWVKDVNKSLLYDEQDIEECREILLNWKDEDPDLVELAADRVGDIEDLLSVDLLVPLVKCSDGNFTFNATMALAKIRSPKAISILIEALIDDDLHYDTVNEVARVLSISKLLATEIKERLNNWLIKQEAPYSQNTQIVIWVLQEYKLDTQSIRSMVDIILSFYSRFKYYRNASLEAFIDKIEDVESVTRILRFHLLENKAIPLPSYIPLECSDMVPIITERVGKSFHLDTSYIEILVKSYKKFPSSSIFSFVPEFMVNLLCLSKHERLSIFDPRDGVDTSFLWGLSSSVNHNKFIKLAWDIILNPQEDILEKQNALWYLKEVNYISDNDEIENLKRVLVDADIQKSSFIYTAINYLQHSLKIKAETLIELVKQYFLPERKQDFIYFIVENAAVQGEFVLEDEN